MRAELMDECLDIVCGLWHGQPFSFSGKHYTVEPTEFPTIGHTVQTPRVPIWCVGALGSDKSMSRARRWDGVIPQVVVNGKGEQASLDAVAKFRAEEHGDVGERPGAASVVIGGPGGSEHCHGGVGRRRGERRWIEVDVEDAIGAAEPGLAAASTPPTTRPHLASCDRTPLPESAGSPPS